MTKLSKLLSSEAKVWIKNKIFFPYRRLSGNQRRYPDFLILGGMKCGTSSLYYNLNCHPQVRSAFRKEVHFFDVNYDKGIDWYKSHFPIKAAKAAEFVMGDASPYYLLHPHVPRRVAHHLPDVKMIILLREPVSRAYSHYCHSVRTGRESLLSFDAAIEAESSRLKGEIEKMMADEFYNSWNHSHLSYISKGLYASQIKRWFEYFPRQQFLILTTEQMATEPSRTYQKVLRFLGLPDWNLDVYEKRNVLSKQKTKGIGRIITEKIDEGVKQKLEDFYAPHNRKLSELLGVDFGWPA